MKNARTFNEFLGENQNVEINEAQGVNIPTGIEGIFVLEKKFPFGLPADVADFYVSRKDGKTGASRWESFEELINANPGVRFGVYANSNRISIYTTMKSGEMLVMSEVYIQK